MTDDIRHRTDILRYWLAAVRFEEALSARPKANRGVQTRPLDLREPSARQPYFKIPLDPTDLSFVFKDEDTSLKLKITGDRVAYTEQWLSRIYRRQRNRWSLAQTDFGSWIGWPTIHFPRSDELATIFRLRVRLDWQSENGEPFEPPSYKQRRQGQFPPPPDHIRVNIVSDDDTALLPYSIDDRLLTQTLGVADEELADLHDCLRQDDGCSPLDMVATVVHLLESQDGQTPTFIKHEGSPDALLERLRSAIKMRLSQGPVRASIYPVMLAYDPGQLQTTHHLQRDLATAIELYRGMSLLRDEHPLRRYLESRRSPLTRAPLYGQATPAPLTLDQRALAELYLGSEFVSAQGPPGTGKTHLILDIAAAHIVQQVREFANEGVMTGDVLVVSSTNNRAVDTVFERLEHDGFPIGIRTGSQVVTSTRTVITITRATEWLNMQPDLSTETLNERLQVAVDNFKALFEGVSEFESARHHHHRQTASRLQLQVRIAQLESLCVGSPSLDLDEVHDLKLLERLLARYATRLSGLARRLDDGPAKLTDARAHFAETRHRFKTKLNSNELTAAIQLPAPPETLRDNQGFCDEWLERVEDAQDELDDVREQVGQKLSSSQAYQELIRLRRELDLIEAPEFVETAQTDELALRHYRLFCAALDVRHAWIRCHKVEIQRALRSAHDAALQSRSLRRHYGDDLATGRWLKQLFPVIGSTLLSLGNVFPSKPDQFERLIIDEGGQCHPAYAVSALLRCQRAMMIGDVHQLEPIVQLTRDDEARVRRATRLPLTDLELEPFRIGQDYPNSAQKLADRAMHDRPALHQHFRSQPQIIAISDQLCRYQLDVLTPKVTSHVLDGLPHAVALLQVKGQQVRVRGSWGNDAELDCIEVVLTRLHNAGVAWEDIAIITPYLGQLEKVRERLRRMRVPYNGESDADGFGPPDLGIAIGTVHRFQGGERRIVLFTTVVSRPRSLFFLNDRVNLVNVAVSRAREQLLIIGDADILKGGEVTGVLVEHATIVR